MTTFQLSALFNEQVFADAPCMHICKQAAQNLSIDINMYFKSAKQFHPGVLKA